MSKFRSSLIGVVALLASVGMALVPAGAAQAAGDPMANCDAGVAPQWDSEEFLAGGNDLTRLDSPLNMNNNDVFRITARGSITIDYWGTRKRVGGDSTTAPAGWPKPGARKYMLLAMVSSGQIQTASGTTYGRNVWFPVGYGTECLTYTRSSSDALGFLTFGYNDDNIGDNGGAGFVTVRQWR